MLSIYHVHEQSHYTSRYCLASSLPNPSICLSTHSLKPVFSLAPRPDDFLLLPLRAVNPPPPVLPLADVSKPPSKSCPAPPPAASENLKWVHKVLVKGPGSHSRDPESKKSCMLHTSPMAQLGHITTTCRRIKIVLCQEFLSSTNTTPGCEPSPLSGHRPCRGPTVIGPASCRHQNAWPPARMCCHAPTSGDGCSVL